MNSNAKLGMLLGLFFIVTISFVINGLPKWMAAPGSTGIDTANGTSLRTTTGDVIEDADRAVELLGGDHGRNIAREPRRTVEVEDIPRHEIDLPRGNQIAGGYTPVQRPQPSRIDNNRYYTVKSGDNLAVIAKKVYGDEEGNRRVNINRIFDANKGQLPSPDKIVVGQKLVIPALTSAQQPAESNTHQEAVPRQRPQAANSTREYIVRKNDNLWRIADDLLGDGKRHAEIKALNSSLLREAKLQPGMRIKIPRS